MTANFDAIYLLATIGLVNHPAREPKYLSSELLAVFYAL